MVDFAKNYENADVSLRFHILAETIINSHKELIFMMKWVMVIMLTAAVVFGAVTDRMDKVSQSFLSECSSAVELAVSLIGIICLWNGVMRVAQKSGMTEILAGFFSPVLGKIFKGLKKGGKAMQYITLNLTANMLGLGNASTPLGISAMREIEKEEQSTSPEKASRNMIILTVMNTASLQLIPTTVSALRLRAGSENPMEILPCVWLVSITALIIALLGVKLFGFIWNRGQK